MKRSAHVAAPLLASAGLAMLAACRQPEMQRCVDEHNVVVDKSLCDSQPNNTNNSSGHRNLPFRYYYGGYGGYGLGSVVGGGGYAPSAGHSYSSDSHSSSTSRGGFGSTHSSGGSGGGGE